ncbi:MAG: DEAD/DEAH box helicase [Propionibacteriaceae bacterium]
MIPSWLCDAEQVRHVHVQPATPGERDSWPSWLPAAIKESLQETGISSPWKHQRTVAEAAYSGRHVAIATGTASGKSLAYLMPVLAATYGGVDASVGVETTSLRSRLMLPQRQHTALYLSPTKALAHDQLRVAQDLGIPSWKVTALDGDSDESERRFARETATWVLTNPDMLHASVLPSHSRWAGFLQSLRYVVVDESHRYKGVFGSHVSAVLRRLRRLCRHYGANPIFICASATSTNTAEAMSALIGVDPTDITVVDQDFSRHGSRTTVLWQPQESHFCDASLLMARCVDEGMQTITFVPSRHMAERIAVTAQSQVTTTAKVAAYRAGYLAHDRRAIEAQLQSGHLAGVAATNALELGVDIAGMDAVIVAGFPGTLSALWQQIGRAGRANQDSLAIVLAKPDPLDAYLFQHPELLFDHPVERTILHPDNPNILGPHLCAAAQESALLPADTEFFGAAMTALADRLVAVNLLRKRPNGWFWARPERAVDSIDIRSSGGRGIYIVEKTTGRVLGEVDRTAADRTVFPGAIYLHQGEQWLVLSLDFDAGEALVSPCQPAYWTQAQGLSEVTIVAEQQRRPLGAGYICFGDVEIRNQVTHYLRRDDISQDVWDETPLTLPAQTYQTQSVWWVLPAQVCRSLQLEGAALGAAAHAQEHTAIGLLSAFASCDRWDVGGLSTVFHPDTNECTIFVHDAHPGGAGFAEAGFEQADKWLTATAERLTNCPCEAGCPACIVSPKCGNANQYLDKADGLRLAKAFATP